MKIVVLDGFTSMPGDISWDPEWFRLGELVVYDRSEPEEVVPRCLDAEIVIINKVVISRTVMEQLPKLRYIGILATGYNVVDIEAADELGIVVTNIPAYSTMSVAQMVFSHLLNICYHVDTHARSVRNGEWNKAADFSYRLTPMFELDGKTMGIVGLGNIGMRVATIARTFGMKVIALTSKCQSELPEWIRKVDEPDDIFKESDVLTLHCPLTASNADFVCERTLALMKPTAVLINTGRGGLVDEQALASALKEGRLTAAALDVLREEPPRNGSPLIGLDNCYITPHIAWATFESRQRLAAIALDNVRAFVEGHRQNHVGKA